MTRIALFLRGHPLKLSVKLKYNGFSPIFPFELNLPLADNSVIITISPIEVFKVVNFLSQNEVKTAKIMSCGTPADIKYLNVKVFKLYKNANFGIKPKDISIPEVNKALDIKIHNLGDLEFYTNFIKLVRKSKLARHPKRKIK